MLILRFQIGDLHCALEASRIVEILPLVDVTPVPQAPPGVAGVLDYRGAPVPVVDLSQVILGIAAARRLSTRVILVRYPDGGSEGHLLGLIAERATETAHRDPATFVPSGVSSDRTPYLGSVASDPRGLLHWLDIEQLLPEPVRGVLFRQAREQPWPLSISSDC